MDAIEFLTKEHEKVRRTFADIEQESHREETKRKMFADLCEELIRHETMEHKVWYPHFTKDNRLNETVRHLLKEEKTAEKTIKEFDKVKTQEEWEAKFIKFKEDVEHHASEEEKNLFPEVRKILSETQLEKIGKDMYEFKRNYTQH